MIRREGSSYDVLSESGGRSFGHYPTKAAAEKRLGQVEYFKHRDAGMLSDERSKKKIANLEGQLTGHRAALAGAAAGQAASNASRMAGNGGQSRGSFTPTPERTYTPGVDFPSAAQIEYGYGPELRERADALGMNDRERLNQLAERSRGAEYATKASYPTPTAPNTTQLDEAFRRPGQYSYEYKDPTVAGAAPGQHIGPMADELSAIPGVVQRGPDGYDRVNTPRLTLATASQTAKHRRELDDLRDRVDALSDQGDYEGVLRTAAGR